MKWRDLKHVSISRLEEQRGWLGVSRRDPGMDPPCERDDPGVAMPMTREDFKP